MHDRLSLISLYNPVLHRIVDTHPNIRNDKLGQFATDCGGGGIYYNKQISVLYYYLLYIHVFMYSIIIVNFIYACIVFIIIIYTCSLCYIFFIMLNNYQICISPISFTYVNINIILFNPHIDIQ